MISPKVTIAAGLAAALAVAVMTHPPVAAYLLVSAALLTAGMERGAVVPLLRPSELLAILLGAGVLARGLLSAGTHGRLTIRFTRIDAALLLFAITGSVVPLLWMAARHEAITQDDVLYALTLWRVYAVFLIVRASVRTQV